eukprot:7700201-Pyramimonas_sp.AAC.1
MRSQRVRSQCDGGSRPRGRPQDVYSSGTVSEQHVTPKRMVDETPEMPSPTTSRRWPSRQRRLLACPSSKRPSVRRCT